MSKNPQFKLRPPVLKLSENDVESGCLDILRLRNYWPVRLHAGLFKSADGKRWIRGVEKGTPDYLAVRPPSFFMETKRPDGILSDDQKRKIDHLQRFFGLETIVVEGAEELLAWLERRDRSP
jgi:hypothetical protein